MVKALYDVTEVPTAAAGKKKNTKKVDLTNKLFNEIAPKYVSRNGGYTRIIKIGQRKGDGAMAVLIELVSPNLILGNRRETGRIRVSAFCRSSLVSAEGNGGCEAEIYFSGHIVKTTCRSRLTERNRGFASERVARLSGLIVRNKTIDTI